MTANGGRDPGGPPAAVRAAAALIVDVAIVCALWWAAVSLVSLVLAFTGWNDGHRPLADAVTTVLVFVVVPVAVIGGYVVVSRRRGASPGQRVLGRRATDRPSAAAPSSVFAWIAAVLLDLVTITALAVPVTAVLFVPLGRRISDRLPPGTGLEGVAVTLLILVTVCWALTAFVYVTLSVRSGATPGMRLLGRRRS